jgi:hypothetical protein
LGFLTPWFLAGAALVGLPIWLHLLQRHGTPTPFSSLMFFERRRAHPAPPPALPAVVRSDGAGVLLALAFAPVHAFAMVAKAGGAAGGFSDRQFV